VDLGTFSEGSTIGLALVITGLAVLGKLVGCGVGGYGLGRRSMLILGVGMVPRGEIGFVVASVALAQGAVGTDVFSSVVFMSIATTLVVPPVLSMVYGRSGALEKDGSRC
jgi:Kef-type K+ transport system membrane component KefB